MIVFPKECENELESKLKEKMRATETDITILKQNLRRNKKELTKRKEALNLYSRHKALVDAIIDVYCNQL